MAFYKAGFEAGAKKEREKVVAYFEHACVFLPVEKARVLRTGIEMINAGAHDKAV